MIKKRFKKKAAAVKDLVPEVVAEKAASLNPLSKDEPPAPIEVPRITNETISEHREEVLKGARKYIYPLQHSKHRIVVITLSLVVGAIAFFLVYCTFALYRFYQYNSFLYRVTQVVPFPIAKAGERFVDYENYLFELRHYVHYYQTQQERDFSGKDKPQLLRFRKQALTDVINQAYIKELASKNGVSVSDKEVNARLAEVRNQNRLGSNNKVFADVLKDYWGWSVNDFKRSLKDQILAEKVAAKLDGDDYHRAQKVVAQLKAGADFTDLAKKYSDDPSAKTNGGDYGFAITKTNPNVPPEVIDTLFSLNSGHYSGIVLASPVLAGSGPTLQIVQVNDKSGNSVTAQHIVINLQDISTYIYQLQKTHPSHTYVRFK